MVQGMKATVVNVDPRPTEWILVAKVARPPKIVNLWVMAASIPSGVVNIVRPAFPLCGVAIIQETAKAQRSPVVIAKIAPERMTGTAKARRVLPICDLGRARGRKGGMAGGIKSRSDEGQEKWLRAS